MMLRSIRLWRVRKWSYHRAKLSTQSSTPPASISRSTWSTRRARITWDTCWNLPSKCVSHERTAGTYTSVNCWVPGIVCHLTQRNFRQVKEHYRIFRLMLSYSTYGDILQCMLWCMLTVGISTQYTWLL